MADISKRWKLGWKLLSSSWPELFCPDSLQAEQGNRGAYVCVSLDRMARGALNIYVHVLAASINLKQATAPGIPLVLSRCQRSAYI
jgi:hypothetical protein